MTTKQAFPSSDTVKLHKPGNLASSCHAVFNAGKIPRPLTALNVVENVTRHWRNCLDTKDEEVPRENARNTPEIIATLCTARIEYTECANESAKSNFPANY